MKSANTTNKSGASKPKKSSKDRDKKKAQNDQNNHTPEKSSPTKDTHLYAGIDSGSISIYGEQCGIDYLKEDISNVLAENINYNLRNIINDALIKARLSGANVITATEIDQTFSDYNIEKVLGATPNPTWISFGYQNLYYLEDKQVNLPNLAERVNVFVQNRETITIQKWLPDDEISPALANYFKTVSKLVTSSEINVRKQALHDIYKNPHIGRITVWFYNYCYVLLAKNNETSVYLNALELLEVLEISPSCRLNAPEKQLNLLSRMLLQRILCTSQSDPFLQPACKVLALMCSRYPVQEFIFAKISQKLEQLYENYNITLLVPVLLLANYIGISAVEIWILPHLVHFTKAYHKMPTPEMTTCLLDLYYTLSKDGNYYQHYYSVFELFFGGCLTMYNALPHWESKEPEKEEINFIRVKCNLIKTRRKIAARDGKSSRKYIPINECFDLPVNNESVKSENVKEESRGGIKFLLKRRQLNWNTNKMNGLNGCEQNVEKPTIVGKTRLLLSIFKPCKQTNNKEPVLLWHSL